MATRSKRKQTLADRLQRLAAGRCPIHGTGMTQVGNAGALGVVECPRRDCTIRGTTTEAFGSVTLLRESSLVLGSRTWDELHAWQERMKQHARHRQFLEN